MTLKVIATSKNVPVVPRGYVDVVEQPSDVIAIAHVPVNDAAEAKDVLQAIDVIDAWLVELRTQWDRSAEPVVSGRAYPGVKQVTFLRRAPALDRDAFATHWTEVHAPLARVHHPALWRYRQNVVLHALTPQTADDVDGVAELTMRLRLDFAERMYDSDAGRQIVGADVRTFLDLRRSRQVWAREYPA